MKQFAFLFCAFLFLADAHAGDALTKLNMMESSALVLVDSGNNAVLEKQAWRKLVPASTVKLVTALIALEHWGRDYQFRTEFYLDKNSNVLIVKGLGDPFLISEELDLIVSKIKNLGIQRLDGIMTDNSYFSSRVNGHGQSKTNNPYDAAASALAVNFNTIEVIVRSGKVTSAEPQTPITPMAWKLARGLADGRHRINLGQAHRSPEYFTQVLTEKLRLAEVEVKKMTQPRAILINPESHLFTHLNSHPLDVVVKDMLEYSNNFIANQLFLLLGIEKWGAPATIEKSQHMLRNYIDAVFSWHDYVIMEGAGLSRANQLSANQLIDVLKKFVPYRNLMPQQNSHILAKSGTLSGVSCYAGYLFRNDEWQAFALLINQPIRYRFREQLAEELLAYEGGNI